MKFTEEYRQLFLDALDNLNLEDIDRAIEVLKQARDSGGQIFVCGNGGSAATASHFTCDMMKCASAGKRKRFSMIALADAVPTVMAYANDVGYDVVFEEQLRNLARSGDVVVAISGSGNSPNVVKALEYAKSIGCNTIALSGRDGGKIAKIADVNIHVKEPHMGRIEDIHMIACHMICYYFMEHEAER